jgi:hypothetical protein
MAVDWRGCAGCESVAPEGGSQIAVWKSGGGRGKTEDMNPRRRRWLAVFLVGCVAFAVGLGLLQAPPIQNLSIARRFVQNGTNVVVFRFVSARTSAGQLIGAEVISAGKSRGEVACFGTPKGEFVVLPVAAGGAVEFGIVVRPEYGEAWRLQVTRIEGWKGMRELMRRLGRAWESRNPLDFGQAAAHRTVYLSELITNAVSRTADAARP